MSETAYEVHHKGEDAWEPVTFHAMWQDLKYSPNELAPDELIVLVDRGETVSSNDAEYRKANSRS